MKNTENYTILSDEELNKSFKKITQGVIDHWSSDEVSGELNIMLKQYVQREFNASLIEVAKRYSGFPSKFPRVFDSIIQLGYKNLKNILDRYDIKLNATDAYGYNLLLYAAIKGKDTIAKLLIKKGADLSVVVGDTNIFSCYKPDNNPEMFGLLMEYGADYSLFKQQTGELLAIANNTQSAHTDKTIIQVYEKLKVVEKKQELELIKEESEKKFLVLLKNTLKPEKGLVNEDFQKLFLRLVKDKLADCHSQKGQGDQFIKDLLVASNSTIKITDIQQKDFNLDLVLKHFAGFIADTNSKEYFVGLATKVEDLAKNLQGNFYIAGATIDKSLLIPLIFSVVTDQQELPRLIIEAIDAATMYSSGGQSCTGGTLNKLAQIFMGHLPEEPVNVVEIKQQFNFAGFKTDYQALVEEIFCQLKDNRSSNLTSLDAQKVRASIYKIMKDLTCDASNFSKIFSYLSNIEGGENIFSNNKKTDNITSFKQQVPYEIIYQVQKEILLKDQTTSYYKIHSQYLPVHDNVANDEARKSIQDITAPLLQKIQNKIYESNFTELGNFFSQNKKSLQDFSDNILKIIRSSSDNNQITKLKGILQDFSKELNDCIDSTAEELINKVNILLSQRGGIKVKYPEQLDFQDKLDMDKDSSANIPYMVDKTIITFSNNEYTYCYKFIDLKIVGVCQMEFPCLDL